MKKTKILVVEDESIVARDISNMLKGLGYEVTGVISTAKEAVINAKETQPDLVLMDIMLQGKTTGLQAADKIYSQFNIPIVYLTAYADKTTLQKAKQTEPFGYLLKPFEERELQTTIEIALYKYKMEMKLKGREQWLTTILQSIEDAVIATDREGLITFMNPLAESLTGWKHEEALRAPLEKVFKVINENSGKRLNIDVNKIIMGDKMHQPGSAMLMSKTRKKTPVDYRESAIEDENGNISGVVLAFTNIARRKKAEEEVKKSWEKLKRAMEGTVQAMAFTIETRDPYTAGHQRRVTQLACEIAEKLGMNKKNIEGLRMAGQLHDIGKIYVPAEILSKPGKISEVEYSIIKTHPQVGYDILKSVEFPWPIAKVVLQHHERIDGTGYPSGLKGKDILLEAKILAVSDVIEAMATHRPYRPALPIEQALEEISKNKNKLYDPDIVDICILLFEKGFTFT